MRATMRITWLLLLSLSFLFHHVCSDDVGSEASKTQPTTSSKPPATRPPTAGDVGEKNSTTQAPTPAKPTAVVTTAQISTVGADKPVTSQPQLTTVIEKTATTPIATSDAAPAEKNGTLTPAPTPNSKGSSVVASSPAPVTPKTLGSSITPGNEVPAISAINTTKKPDTATDVPSSREQSTTQTNPTSKEDNKETKTATSPTQKTKDGPSVTDPLVTKAGPTSLQNTSTPNLTKATTIPTATATTTPAATATTTPAATATTTPAAEATNNPAAMVATTTITATTNPTATGTTTTTPTATATATTTTTTTTNPTATATTTTTTSSSTTATTAAQKKTFLYSLNNGHKKEENDLVKLCIQLMDKLKDGNCSLAWTNSSGTVKFQRVEINGMVKTDVASQHFEEILKLKKGTDSTTLIAILASCGALLIMIVILAVCASHHRKPYNENQQHLTEELHTVENGYHDNPTLEVMEVQPEMQEKKMVLNGEFNDSWIVPIDNLLKEDMPDEEDTHL